jgi:uncharacterized protein YlxW (UPF0749 family)
MSNNTISLQSIAADQLAARKEYDRKTAEFTAQLNSRISAYNETVHNTLRKFASDYTLVSILSRQLIIPSKAVFVDFKRSTQEYVFEANGQQQSIHASLLCNDPIAVAMHTRKAIRKLQSDERAESYLTAKKNLATAKKVLQDKQADVNNFQKKMDAAEAQSKREEARIMKRMEKKRKVRAAADARAK